MSRFSYSPGPSVAVVSGDWAVMTGLGPDHPLVARLYRLLVSGPSMDDVTDVLAGAYGAFADVVVLHAADPVHTFIWGSAGAESTAGMTLAGGSMGVENRLPGLVGAWLGPVPVPSVAMLPAGQGVFLAGRIETVPAAPDAGVAPVQAPTQVPPIVPPVAVEPPATGPQSPSAVVYGGSPLAAPVSPAVEPLPTLPLSPVYAAALLSQPAPVPPAMEDVYVPVAPPPMAADQQQVQQVEIDYTMRPRTALVRVCRNGHTNPAYLGECAICGQSLGGAPQEVPQPSLGRIVISTGGEVALDHDSILGRAPKLPRGMPGEPPELVKVADPTNDVSKSHLQVRVTDWKVFVRDLGSTNGTEVVRPGWPPVALGKGQETVIGPGTKVILGGVVTLTYEPAQD